jgi:hypothetical protein
VLAVDQVAHQEKDQQFVVGKTATLELTPDQTELLAQSQLSGVVSLVLRSLGDSEGQPVANNTMRRRPPVGGGANGGANSDKSAVTVFRYGILRGNSPAGVSSGGSNSGGTVVASNNSGGSASGSAPTPAPITNPITVTTTTVPTGVLQ